MKRKLHTMHVRLPAAVCQPPAQAPPADALADAAGVAVHFDGQWAVPSPDDDATVTVWATAPDYSVRALRLTLTPMDEATIAVRLGDAVVGFVVRAGEGFTVRVGASMDHARVCGRSLRPERAMGLILRRRGIARDVTGASVDASPTGPPTIEPAHPTPDAHPDTPTTLEAGADKPS